MKNPFLGLPPARNIPRPTRRTTPRAGRRPVRTIRPGDSPPPERGTPPGPPPGARALPRDQRSRPPTAQTRRSVRRNARDSSEASTFDIQAKRPKNAAPVGTVRALAGVTHPKDARYGILVTTSWSGEAGYDFAHRNGRIRLIDGRNLKALLAEHLNLAPLIGLPQLPQAGRPATSGEGEREVAAAGYGGPSTGACGRRWGLHEFGACTALPC
ncbi:restriction endonuclease [Kitasatospora sp. NPDC086801]|uniref:restriction endonuclease n=1 Tax=Kitasatospora sp. NPDC086801 TaxID=3364066 RepID=UPI0038101F10